MITGYFSSTTNTTVLVMLYRPDTGKIKYLPITSTPAMSDEIAQLACTTAMANDSTYASEKNDLVQMLSIVSSFSN